MPIFRGYTALFLQPMAIFLRGHLLRGPESYTRVFSRPMLHFCGTATVMTLQRRLGSDGSTTTALLLVQSGRSSNTRLWRESTLEECLYWS